MTHCREEITRSITSLDDNLKRIEGMILGYKDARTLLQKLAGKPNERLSELHQAYTNTHFLATEARQELLKIEDRWGKECGHWEHQSEAINAQVMAVQERSASGLRDIRDDVMRELECQQSDLVRQKARADEWYVDMLVNELKAGTDTEQLKEVQIKWQLGDHPSAEAYFDAMLERAQRSTERAWFRRSQHGK